MAELAVTDGMPPPPDLPCGEVIVTRLADGCIRIGRADPRILISGQLLDIIADGGGSHAELDTAQCKPGHGYVGAILKLDGVNGQLAYRITDMAPRVNGYIGERLD